MARARKGLTETEEASSTTVSIQVQALGASQIHLGRERLSPVSETLFGVMVRIVFAPGMQLSRAELLNMFWPGQPEVRQRGNLRQNLYKLRQIGVLMDVRGDSVRLNASQVVPTFSVARTPDAFRRSVLEAGEPLGPFLAGYVSRSPELNEWIAEVREVIHSDVRRVLVEELRGSRERVDWSYAERLCRWLLQFDPLNEDATLTLAECIALSGGKAQAVEVLDRYLEELGSDAGDIRLPAARLRHRLTDSGARRIPAASTERHFVGRTEELSDFTLALRRARWRDGSGHLLHGPPGMGKTRLTQELEKVAEIEGMLTLRYTCRESDSMRLLSVAMDMVSELLQAPGALGCAPETLRTLRRLVGQEPVPVTADGTPALREPLPAPAILRSAMVDLVAAVSDEKPVYLVLDDVHWMDLQSWEVFVDIIEQSETTRVCVLATSRVGHACATVPQRAARRLLVRELKRLTDAEATDLAERIAADLHFDVSGGMAEVIAYCEGSPLFIQEILIHHHTFGSNGHLPRSITQAFQRRLGLLSPLAFRTIQVVAKMQPYASITLASNVLNVSITEYADALDELAASNLVHIDSTSHLTCHGVIATVALNGLSGAAACMLHLRIADALANIPETSPARDIHTIQHLILAGEKERSLDLLFKSLPLLKNSSSSHSLLGLLESLLGRFSDLRKNCEVSEVLYELLFLCGRHSQLLELVPPGSIENEDHKWDLSHPHECIRIANSIAYVDSSYVDEMMKRLSAIAESTDIAIEHRAGATATIVKLASDTAAAEVAHRAYDSFEAIRANTPQITVTQVDMFYHTVFGDLGEALKAATNLKMLAAEVKDAHARLGLLVNSAYAFRYCGPWENAQLEFQSLYEEACEIGHAPVSAISANQLCLMALERSRDLGVARQWNEVLQNIAASLKEPLLHALALNQSARLALEMRETRPAMSMLAEIRRITNTAAYSTKLKAYVSAMELDVALQQRDPFMVEQSTSIVIDAFRKVRALTGNDYLFSVIVEALTWLRDAGKLRWAISEIQHCRREVAPPNKRLENSMQRAEAYLTSLTLRPESSPFDGRDLEFE